MLELTEYFISTVFAHFARVRVHIDYIAHFHTADINFDGHRTGIFHGVKEDRCDFAAEYKSALSLVWYVGDVITHQPQQGIGCRLSR